MKGGETVKSNPFVKLVAVLAIALLGLWLLQAVLFSAGTGTGMSYNFRGNFGGEHMNVMQGYGVGYGFSMYALLLLLTKVLFAVFVIALVAGIIVWVKNNLFTTEDYNAMRYSLKGNASPVTRLKCSICSNELNADWKVCPHCGKEVEVNNV